jgi:hypothetical protein
MLLLLLDPRQDAIEVEAGRAGRPIHSETGRFSQFHDDKQGKESNNGAFASD